MDYKKGNEAYKEAFRKAETYYYKGGEDYKTLLSSIFPELKESEDERIRKALIHLVNSNKELSFGIDNYDGIKWSDILTWLEKQGEQSNINPDDLVLDLAKRGISPISIQAAIYRMGVEDAIEKLKVEQKSTDKVEPIFNVGDKIQYLKGCGTIMTIEKIENGEYIFANNMGHTTIENGNKCYLVEQKPAWGEEDRDYIDTLIGILNERMSNSDEGTMVYNTYKKVQDWLKSISHQKQWKPSDEQMYALEYYATSLSTYSDIQDDLFSLLKSLKKLREE